MSGFQYRQQRLQKNEKNKKLAYSLKKYLHQDQEDDASAGPSSAAIASFETEKESNLLHVEESSMDAQEESSVSDVIEVVVPQSSHVDESEITGNATTALDGLLSEDPGEWPEIITSALSRVLIEKGPYQVTDWNYPVNENGRKFSTNYYYRQLPNGEKVKRDWLVYSVSQNSVYCFCCKIFGKNPTNLSNREGFSDWQHLSFTLSRHEKSIAHNENVKAWLNLGNMLSKKLL